MVPLKISPPIPQPGPTHGQVTIWPLNTAAVGTAAVRIPSLRFEISVYLEEGGDSR
jgi:hypothetical protein